MEQGFIKQVNNYCFQECVGSGNYSKVYKALNSKTNEVVAIKEMEKAMIQYHGDKLKELFYQEIHTLKKLTEEYEEEQKKSPNKKIHFNIVRYIDHFENEQFIFLIEEYCDGGDIRNIMSQSPSHVIPERVIHGVLKQLLSAFIRMHRNNVIHRDLKPENILIKDQDLKIADFGFCKQLGEKSAKTKVGTPLYSAPEILSEDDVSYGLETDMYSFGCLVYFLVFGKVPFEANNEVQLLKLIKEADIKFPEDHVTSEIFQHLLRKMLEFNKKDRITWPALYQHPFILNNAGMYGSLLKNISSAFLNSYQIDIEGNLKFYKEKEKMLIEQSQIIQNEEFKIENHQSLIKQVEPIQQQEEIDSDQITTINNRQSKKKSIQVELQRVQQLYNKQLSSIHLIFYQSMNLGHEYRLQQTKANIKGIQFMTFKITYLMHKDLTQNVLNDQNIFKCKYEQELFDNQQYQDYKQLLQNELQTLEMWKPYKLQDGIDTQNYFNSIPQYKNEINLDNLTNQSIDIMKLVAKQILVKMSQESKNLPVDNQIEHQRKVISSKKEVLEAELATLIAQKSKLEDEIDHNKSKLQKEQNEQAKNLIQEKINKQEEEKKQLRQKIVEFEQKEKEITKELSQIDSKPEWLKVLYLKYLYSIAQLILFDQKEVLNFDYDQYDQNLKQLTCQDIINFFKNNQQFQIDV